MTTNDISFTECMVFTTFAAVLGGFVGAFIETLDTVSYVRPSQLNGVTYSQVEEMKQQCEAALPRNKSCVSVLTFVESGEKSVE